MMKFTPLVIVIVLIYKLVVVRGSMRFYGIKAIVVASSLHRSNDIILNMYNKTYHRLNVHLSFSSRKYTCYSMFNIAPKT